MLLLGVIIGTLLLRKVSCNDSLPLFDKKVTIAQLRDNPGMYADSPVILNEITVESCQSLMNYTRAIILDASGKKMTLITTRPYKRGEVTTIRGKMVVLLNNGTEQFLLFIDERLKPLNGNYKKYLSSPVF